jgi:hypothetical protein
MTTILVINAVSCCLATMGIGGLLAWQERRFRREIVMRTLYVTTNPTLTPPRR